jgi:hypothetical protein
MRHFALMLIGFLTAGSACAETAFTTRATDLQAQGQLDSKVLASLPENTKLEVLRRVGAWDEVKTSSGQSGWVRMMNLRFDSAGATKGSGSMSAINELISSGRTGNTATVTTGVRGLTEEDLKNAKSNPAEFARMQKNAVDKPTAQAFAQRSKLNPNRVDYLQATSATSAPSSSSPASGITSPELQN